ncbi:GNAT family N-acetyltransferase [Nonomuraea sp. NPDC050663]|uniref:GNAT family N-acetyltransferase n=1 Tax=Nonomuraea sp. NPDC050663 TaxID=3364370 RepID=UPI0037896633
MKIVEMTDAHAADIATWRYPAPYDAYSLTGTDPAFFTDPANGYVALLGDDEMTLIGYRVFGPDGRVPGGVYDDTALDTGGGLRPELTGQGLGRRAIATGLAYGAERFDPPAFRMTVAAFNARVQRVVTSLGFVQTQAFEATTDGRSYLVFTRPLTLPLLEG